MERGFLGTNASLTSDLSLVMGIALAALLTLGVVLARRKRFTAHRWVQSAAVTLNVVQVATVMLGSYARSASPGVPHKLDDGYYAIALAHGLVGLATLLFGVFVAMRANELVPSFLRFHNFKLFMRAAYGLYMLSTVLGVSVYAIWYGPSQPTQKPLAQAADESEIVIPMVNFVFSPLEIVVPVGTTVVWVNQDAAPHTATADDGRAFNTDILAKGQSFSFTATQAGEFSYFCELHGSAGGVGMAGKITVVGSNAPQPVAAPAPTAVAPTAVPAPAPTPSLFGLPTQAGAYVDRLLVDGPGLPVKQGYAVGLRRESQELLRHARLLTAAEATGDLAGVRRHAEHGLNLIVGAQAPDYGDVDRDGKVQNPGDGFGLLSNGDQAGYIRATLDAAIAAEMAPDASPSILIHAAHVRTVSIENLHGWATEAHQLALELARADNLFAVERPASRLLVLAKWLELGNDLNGDGELSPTPGEGGGLVAYEHARFMAGLGPSHHQ